MINFIYLIGLLATQQLYSSPFLGLLEKMSASWLLGACPPLTQFKKEFEMFLRLKLMPSWILDPCGASLYDCLLTGAKIALIGEALTMENLSAG